MKAKQKELYYFSMLTIKTQYKGKLTNLGKNISSLEAIYKELQHRFPQNFPSSLAYFIDHIPISSFQQVLNHAQTQHKNSIKIQVQPQGLTTSKLVEKSQNNSQLHSLLSSSQHSELLEYLESSEKDCSFSSEKKECPQKIEEVQLIDLKESFVESIHQPVLHLFKSEQPQIRKFHKDFYTCFKCQGKGIQQQSDSRMICSLCGGQGNFGENHEWIEFIDRMISQRINRNQNGRQAAIEAEKVEERPQHDELVVNVRKASFKAEKSEIYEADVKELSKRMRDIEVGRKFYWLYQVTNKGTSKWPKGVEIYESENNYVTELLDLAPGESTNITVGPFQINKEGAFEKVFYFCYISNGEIIRFGNKFGFNVRGIKVPEVKQIDTSYLNIIQQVKKQVNSLKSVEFLVEKLKQLGVNASEIQKMDRELLADIIRSTQ